MLKSEEKGAIRAEMSNTLPSISHRSQHVQSRLSLFWAKACVALYQRLCAGVLREVSAYLCFQPQLLSAVDSALWSFSPASERWTRQSADFSSFTEALFVGEDCIFVNYSDNAKGKTAIIEKGRVEDVLPLGRRLFGYTYDSAAHRVCVFGGFLCQGVLDSAQLARFDSHRMRARAPLQCRQLVISAREWQRLPRLTYSRVRCSACWHGGLCYVCGGGRMVVETLNPATNAMTCLSCFLIPKTASIVAAAACGNTIAVICGKELRKWAVASRQTVQVKALSEVCSFGKCAPVACGGWLYWDADAFTGRYSALCLEDGQIHHKQQPFT